MSEFQKELSAAINRCCMENDSNTPDWILAQYLSGCLAVFGVAVQQRENWYGRDPRPSNPFDAKAGPDARPAGIDTERHNSE